MTLTDQFGSQPREAFYGGAAGGGKSEALLMSAAQYVEVPGYSSLILRKTLPDLNQSGALIPRSHEWWGRSSARWHEYKKTWTFPSGAVIRFGYLENRSDLDNYMGSEYQHIAFDEATQFALDLYRFLFSRLRRRLGMKVPLRVRSASNPGNVGHEWVKQRFIVEGEANGRVFVPAKLLDNPSLDADEYVQSLNELDPVTRAQLLEGDWDVLGSGGNFKRAWFDVIDVAPASVERVVRYWDTASTAPLAGRESEGDWTVGTKMARVSGMYYIMDVVRFQGGPSDVERAILNTARADGADVEIYMEQEPGASGKIMIEHYQFRVLHGYYFQGIRSTGPKPARAARFASMCDARNVKLVRGNWISKWLDEHEAFPHGAHDDQVDSSAGAFNQLTLGGDIRPANRRLADLFSWRS